jgi:hypothetical protein
VDAKIAVAEVAGTSTAKGTSTDGGETLSGSTSTARGTLNARTTTRRLTKKRVGVAFALLVVASLGSTAVAKPFVGHMDWWTHSEPSRGSGSAQTGKSPTPDTVLTATSANQTTTAATSANPAATAATTSDRGAPDATVADPTTASDRSIHGNGFHGALHRLRRPTTTDPAPTTTVTAPTTTATDPTTTTAPTTTATAPTTTATDPTTTATDPTTTATDPTTTATDPTTTATDPTTTATTTVPTATATTTVPARTSTTRVHTRPGTTTVPTTTATTPTATTTTATTTTATTTVPTTTTTTTTSTTGSSSSTGSSSTAVVGSDCAGVPGSGVVDQASLDACGLPSMDSTGPAAGTSFTDSNGFTASTPGATYSGLNVTGGISITASDVTIQNSTVTDVNPDTAAIQVANDVTGVRIVNDSIHGTNASQSGALAFAVSYFGSSLSGLTIDHTNFYNGDRILAGYGTVTNSYCLGGANFDSSSGSLEHDECVYTDGGAPGIRAIHDTLINANPDQTAAIFVDNPDFGGGGTAGTVDVEDSLLAGGDYCIYAGAGNAGTVHTGPVTIINNRFSRLFFSTAGQYGPEAYLPGDADWSGNVWDDTNQTVPSS